MGMFDDLDPDFISSPGPALPMVAERVWAVRKRRWIVVGSVTGAAAVVMLGTMAFSSGGKPDKLTVANVTTTTDDSSSTTDAPLITAPTTSAATSTTTAATSTTVTMPVASTSTSEATTTTTPPPAQLTVAFDRDSLVMQSGTKKTISYTVTNTGGREGGFAISPASNSLSRSVWPKPARGLPWPEPASPSGVTPSLTVVKIRPQESVTLSVTIVAGREDGRANVVPAPPGLTSLVVTNLRGGGGEARLPVTVTPPDTRPLTVDHPSEVTTGSDQQHVIDFTITNNLPFPVRYADQGPCSSETGVWCRATTPDGAITMDMRLPPYDKAIKPLYVSHFLLGANEVKVAHAQMHGTTSLEDIDLGSPALPAGIYHFDWDGEKVKFTVTP